MIGIRIGSEYLDLSPDSRIRLKLRSQVFSREFVTAGYSYPISLPQTAANRRLLRHAERIGKSGTATEVECTIELGGAPWRQAVLVLRGVGATTYDVDLRVPEDPAITLLRQVSTKDLPQTYDFSLDDGTTAPFVSDDIDAMHSRIASRLAPATDTDIIFAPVRNTGKWGDREGRYFNVQTGPGSDYPEINTPHEYVNHYDAEHPHPFLRYRFTNPVDRIYGELSAFPYLWNVVRHMLQLVGYRLAGDVFDHPEVRTQVVLNNVLQFSAVITNNGTQEVFPNYGTDNPSMRPLYPTLRLADLLPRLTGIELLVRLMKRYNAVPLFRSGRRLELRSMNAILDDVRLFDLEPYATTDPAWEPEPGKPLALTENDEPLDEGRLDEEWQESRVVGEVDTADALGTLTAANGDLARVRADGKIYKFAALPGAAGTWQVWADDLLPLAAGSDADSTDVGVGLTAMWRGEDTLATNPRTWLVPTVAMRLSDVESDWHALGRSDTTTLRLLFYRGLAKDSADNDYPLLSNDIYDQAGNPLPNATMAEKITGERGIYATWYQRWVQLLQQARVRRLPTRLPLHLLRNWPWDRKVYLQGHHYLVREIDAEFTPRGMGLPVLELVKLQAAGRQGVPFACQNVPNSFSLEYTGTGAADLLVVTSSGYFTVRTADGEEATFTENIDFTGQACLWASDENGTPQGTVLEIYFITQDLEEGSLRMGLARVANTLLTLAVHNTALTAADLPAMPNVQLIAYTGAGLTAAPPLAGSDEIEQFDAPGNAFTQSAVDAILAHLVSTGLNGGYVDLSGGTSSAPSAGGLLDVAELEGRGWTVVVN